MTRLDFSALKKAIDSFTRTREAALEHKIIETLSPALQEAVKAGVIQNFEFTYELAWKSMKRWLESNYGSQYVDGVTRRELFRLACESHLINEVDEWMFFHRARNQTSHTYNDDMAEEIYQRALNFLPLVNALYTQLDAKSD